MLFTKYTFFLHICSKNSTFANILKFLRLNCLLLLNMKKLFTLIFVVLFALSAMAKDYFYYAGVTAVSVADLSSGSTYLYKVTISQSSRNTLEEPWKLYNSKSILYLQPKTKGLEGTYSTDNDNFKILKTSTRNSMVQYDTEERPVNSSIASSITIAKIDQSHYCIAAGTINVQNSDKTNKYKYEYCFSTSDLNVAMSALNTVPKKSFVFAYTSSGSPYNYDMHSIHDMNVSGATVAFACKGDRWASSSTYDYTVSLNFGTSDIQGEFSNVFPVDGKSILSTSSITTDGTTRYVQDYLYSHLQIVKDAEDNLTICGGTLSVGTGDESRNYHFAETVKIDDSKTNNEVLLNSCSKLVDPIANVQLIRSLTSASYNTFCAPFAMTEEQIAEVFGAGADIRALESSSYDAEKNEFTLNFSTTSLTEMEAGKPYLVKPTSDVANPKFSSIEPTAFATAAKTVSTSVVDFVGVLSPFTLADDDETILFLAGGNELKYSKAGTMKGMRGYFQLKQAAPAGARARIVMEKETTTGVENVSSEKKYGEPTKRLVNGQLVILRDGKMYNVQGVQL